METINRLQAKRVAWNKGRKATPEEIEKNRLGHLGQKPWNTGTKGVVQIWNKGKRGIYSQEVRKRMSESHKGAKNINWKGGVSTQNKLDRVRFAQSITYQVLKRDNYTCQMCSSKTDLHVDHIQPWAEYVELRFNMDNCRTICRSCHYEITYNKKLPPHSKWGTKSIKEVRME